MEQPSPDREDRGCLSQEAEAAERAGEPLPTRESRIRRGDSGLARTLRRFAAAADQGEFLDAVLTALLERTGARSGSFWMYDPATETSDRVATIGGGPEAVRECVPPEFLGRAGAQTLDGAPIFFADTAHDGKFRRSPDPSRIGDGPSLLCIPLLSAVGFLGLFILYSRETRPYHRRDMELAQALAQQAIPVLRLTRRADHEREAAISEERNRLACEIHDALAQHFAGILLQLGVARRIAPQQPGEAWNLVEQASALARTGAEEARRSIWALQPAAAEYRDLRTALPHAVAQLTADTPVEGTVQISGTPRLLPSDIGLNLLRIAQEAVNNTLRHARARRLVVLLAFEPTQVRLLVRDDGQGFDSRNPREGGGFGLFGMRQRAERIGGRLTITSQPGHGTEVCVLAPMESAPAKGVEEESK